MHTQNETLSSGSWLGRRERNLATGGIQMDSPFDVFTFIQIFYLSRLITWVIDY